MNIRTFIAALTVLISASVYACPQLAGQYKCNEEDGTSFTLKLSQDAKGNVEVFRIDQGADIVTDNQPHPFQYSDSLKEATLRAWCDDNVTLHTQTLGKQLSGGAYFGDLVSNEDYSLSGKSLHMLVTGHLNSAEGTYPLHGDQTCEPVP